MTLQTTDNKYSYMFDGKNLIGVSYKEYSGGWRLIVKCERVGFGIRTTIVPLSKWWLIRKIQVWNFNLKRNTPPGSQKNKH